MGKLSGKPVTPLYLKSAMLNQTGASEQASVNGCAVPYRVSYFTISCFNRRNFHPLKGV